MEPLTEEQRKFAEEHAGLIWWFIDRYHLGKGNAEERHDWYFILAEAYLRAVIENNPKIPCSFSSFAIRFMWKQMVEEFSKRGRRKSICSFSYLEDYENWEKRFGSEEDLEEIVLSRVYAYEKIAKIWPKLTPTMQKAVSLRAEGLTYVEASKRMNISRLSYYRNLLRARRRAKNEIAGWDSDPA